VWAAGALSSIAWLGGVFGDSLDGRVFMEMVLVEVVSRGIGGLPCALLGDILWLSRVRRTQ
jgi:hypothetical protein